MKHGHYVKRWSSDTARNVLIIARPVRIPAGIVNSGNPVLYGSFAERARSVIALKEQPMARIEKNRANDGGGISGKFF